ncbi:MAG: glycosyltransferase family 1 protein [Methylobacter sp.]|nr:glycosyltransferase family 1 protein [Methylobacter sp.]
MKIAFDSQIFTMQEHGGISRYACNLATQLATVQGVNVKVCAPFHINAYLDEMPAGLVWGVRVPKIRNMGRMVGLTSSWISRFAMAGFAPQIVHETYFAQSSVAPKSARRVITVYDMVHERFTSVFPKDDRTVEFKKTAITRADHVICISENTRRDLLDLIPIPPQRVSVVHLGFEPFAFLGQHNVPIEAPYVLYVGGRGGYKNFKGLLEAYASSNWLKNNIRIVCFGDGPLRIGELELMGKLGISNHQVVQVSGSDEQLAGYYQNAAAFVYPSLYEGFGIPPLEAMSLQCPVICSNTSSIPEVVGDAGEYFEPAQIDSMRVAMETVLQSSERRNALIQRGLKKCAEYSWERCAEETLAVYRSLVL